jgi:hypothetical protein
MVIFIFDCQNALLNNKYLSVMAIKLAINTNCLLDSFKFYSFFLLVNDGISSQLGNISAKNIINFNYFNNIILIKYFQFLIFNTRPYSLPAVCVGPVDAA